MKYQNRFLRFPLIVISIIIIFWVYSICSRVLSLVALQKKYTYQYPISWSLIFDIQTKIGLVCVLISLVTAIGYFIMRQRYVNIFYCRVHVWLSFIALVLVPLSAPLFKMSSPNGIISDAARIGNFIIYPASTILLLVFYFAALFFFAITLIKSSTSPKEAGLINESSDFLNQFSK
ncbi:hypothetical protein PDL71_14530 [Lacibacter sp. MH-610]|uniref:hypothetical protein n=1 Tax=Lacibacter sp. MH-610 TaxID=3020883 RepID=UPI00389132B6